MSDMEGHTALIDNIAYRPVAIDSLDFCDTRLDLLYTDPDARISAQVREFGMIQPLPVWERDDGRYRLLAGHAYLPVLRLFEIREVFCQVFAANTPPSILYPLQILHGLSTLTTSPVLQALLLDQAQHSLKTNELLRLLPLMGHKAQAYKIKELTALLHLQPAVLSALHQGTLAIKTVKSFNRLPDDEQQNLVELITRFRAGGSKQQKLVEMLIELRLRHDQPIHALLHPWLAEQPQEDDNLPQQLHNLLHHLHERCAPHSTEAEKTFQRLVRELSPPPQLRINHCPAFEDESMEVTIRFANQAELRYHWPTVLDLTNQPK